MNSLVLLLLIAYQPPPAPTAALVPQSVPFKDLTVERLVALNHGTISSPIPGQETGIAQDMLR